MLQNLGDLRVFSGEENIPLATSICEHLDIKLGNAESETFPDGERIVRINDDVRGKDCFVVISTCYPVNDNLMELFIFADTLRRASAGRITAVIPYYGYARQDRKAQGRTPITAKLCANLLVQAGFDRILLLDLHSAQIQGFFDIPVDHLSASKLFLEYFKSIREQMGDLVVLSPDVGNMKVAEGYAGALDAEMAVIDKRRISGSETSARRIIGDVEGKNILMIDDMISTAGTMSIAALRAKDNGANKIWMAATHPVFSGNAKENLEAAPIKELVVADTIPLNGAVEDMMSRVRVLSTGPLFAKAIKHIHNNESVSAMFNGDPGSKR